MVFKFQWHIDKLALGVRSGPGFTSTSPLNNTKRLCNQREVFSELPSLTLFSLTLSLLVYLRCSQARRNLGNSYIGDTVNFDGLGGNIIPYTMDFLLF